MKHILTFLLVSLITYTSYSYAVNHSPANEEEYLFTIHVGAFVKANLSDFKDIRPYGFMYTQDYNNLLQVYMGDYPTEPDAMKVLEKVKRHGYPGAFITRRSLKKGKNVRVIQVVSNDIGEDIDWQRFSTAGQLYATYDGSLIKLMVGPFENTEETNDYLSKLRQIGFEDAFAKKVNNVLLHKITAFEAGQAIEFPGELEVEVPEPEEIVVKEAEQPAAAPSLIVKKRPKKETPEVKKEEKEVLTAREVTPESFDTSAKSGRIDAKPKTSAPKAKAVTKKPVSFPAPDIRSKVKRTSAIELQKALKAEQAYTGSLDGFYGPGTAKGWEKIKQSNAQLKKYMLLSTQSDILRTKGTSDVLQHYINTLWETPEKSLKGLKTSDEAIAKAYRAYYLFAKEGAGQAVNDLMNSAIRQAFSNKKLQNKPKFDYKATYDYNSLEQLILHLRYIQGASQPEPAAPAWLFVQHAEAAQKAYNTYSHPIDNEYNVQDCSQFMDWEALNLLKVILNDLNTNTGKAAQKQQAANDASSTRLLLSAKPLKTTDRVKIIEWNTAFWAKMDTWAKNDPLHQKFLTPLKIAYCQSWVQLEDYFMDKGVNPQEAKGLALAVLKNMVEVPLEDME